MNIRFTPDALSDHDRIVEIARRDYPGHADRIIARMNQVFDQLIRFPRIGAEVEPSFVAVPGLRCVPMPRVGHHVIYYLVHNNDVEIVRILHGAMDTRAIFGDAE